MLVYPLKKYNFNLLKISTMQFSLGLLLAVALVDAAALVKPHSHQSNEVSPNNQIINRTASNNYQGTRLPLQMLP